MNEKAPEFVVYAEGLCFASVCSNLPQEEVEQRMGLHPCGTQAGWQLADCEFASGDPNPSPCNDFPETNKHYLFAC